MRTSPAGIALIKQFEGFMSQPYTCAGGMPTIGYGHVISGNEQHLMGKGITQAQATQLLQQDLARFESSVSRAVSVPVNQHQFDALVSFAYNVGGSAMASSTLVKKLNAGDKAGAKAEFSRWNKAGGKVLPGLVKRRQQEAELFGSP